MRWSYTIYRTDEDLDSVQQALETFGQDGWELVTVTHNMLVDENNVSFDQYTCFLKRPI